jgi:hypothetical protein
MERNQVSRLSPYQSLVLAVIMSMLTALAVLFALRLRDHTAVSEPAAPPPAPDTNEPPAAPAMAPADAAQPAVSTASQTEVPNHFSEDLIVPGFTHTGPEIVEQDIREGARPDGV